MIRSHNSKRDKKVQKGTGHGFINCYDHIDFCGDGHWSLVTECDG